MTAQAGGREARTAWSCLLLSVLAGVILYCGWSFFWFLCDDAYIAFRYVSNSQLGLGYVWNAPPFLPVEGYTSLLWLWLLDGVWSLTGMPPPQSANALSLGFGCASLALVGRMTWRMPLSPRMEASRAVWLWAVVLATVTNRTFLTWTTSGLETALFSFLILSWTYLGLWVERGPRWSFLLAGLAALIELTRPDGLLFVVVSMAAVGLTLARARSEHHWTPAYLFTALPFAVPLAHLLWRHQTYGFWLPNTYYAKHVEAWPTAGAAYFTSFLLEYAFWLPLGLTLFWLVQWWRGRTTADRRAAAITLDRVATWVLVGGLIAQLLYYTLRVGGDHFEYRIYHHWVPLIFVASVWIMDRLGWEPRRAVAAFAVGALLSLPIPWLHKSLASERVTREQTRKMWVPIAPHLPGILRPYAHAFDALQGWLIPRLICNRHQTHKVFAQYQTLRYPSRAEGRKIASGSLPVHDAWSVGVAGWSLPGIAIIDKYGLNDRVVARTPIVQQETRHMGHDRTPPPGYLKCFRPNIRFDEDRLAVKTRAKELTPEDVRECERRFMP